METAYKQEVIIKLRQVRLKMIKFYNKKICDNPYTNKIKV